MNDPYGPPEALQEPRYCEGGHWNVQDLIIDHRCGCDLIEYQDGDRPLTHQCAASHWHDGDHMCAAGHTWENIPVPPEERERIRRCWSIRRGRFREA